MYKQWEAEREITASFPLSGKCALHCSADFFCLGQPPVFPFRVTQLQEVRKKKTVKVHVGL